MGYTRLKRYLFQDDLHSLQKHARNMHRRREGAEPRVSDAVSHLREGYGHLGTLFDVDHDRNHSVGDFHFETDPDSCAQQAL